MSASILTLTYDVCCILYLIYLGEQIYHWTVKEPKKIIYASLIYIFALFLHVAPIDSTFPFFFLFYIGELLTWMMLCSAPWKTKIPVTLFLFFFVEFIDSILRAFLDMIIVDYITHDVKQIISIFLIFILTTIITRQNWFIYTIKYRKSLSKWQFVLIFSIVFIGTGIASIASVLQEMMGQTQLLLFFRALTIIALCIILCIIICLVIECYKKKYYFEQNLLKEEFISIQQNYYRTLYEKDKELRSFRHDIANQLSLLQILLERGEVEQAQEQLNQCHKEFKQTSFDQIYVGNEILDAVLSMIKQNASADNIDIEITGKINNEARYDVYHLCTIFSNAINNGMDACKKMAQKGTVSVKILEHKHTLFCSFTNPASDEMFQAIIDTKTLKPDTTKHGYGVYNIKRAVEYLNGTMEYRFEDNKVILEIFI